MEVNVNIPEKKHKIASTSKPETPISKIDRCLHFSIVLSKGSILKVPGSDIHVHMTFFIDTCGMQTNITDKEQIVKVVTMIREYMSPLGAFREISQVDG